MCCNLIEGLVVAGEGAKDLHGLLQSQAGGIELPVGANDGQDQGKVFFTAKYPESFSQTLVGSKQLVRVACRVWGERVSG